MRHAIALPLIAFALIGCRPLDSGAPFQDGEAPALAALDDNRSAMPPSDLRGGVRLIDGDTFEIEGETVRISNIDTPELPPRSRCLAEQRLAVAAKAALGDVLEMEWGSAPVLQRNGRDRYGRTLALVSINGRDVGEEMVRLGVAEPWGGRRASWCSTSSDWSSLGAAVTK